MSRIFYKNDIDKTRFLCYNRRIKNIFCHCLYRKNTKIYSAQSSDKYKTKINTNMKIYFESIGMYRHFRFAFPWI
jgi:hypothetical protein